MHDMKNLLSLALDDPMAPAPGPADPQADLLRGRRVLRRVRATRATGAAAAAALLGVGVLVAFPAVRGGLDPGVGTGRSTGSALAAPSVRQTPPNDPATAGTAPAVLTVALVAYSGEQVPGYRVREVPEGWEIQGGDAYALTLAPKGAKDQDVNSFVGKIAVMLESKDAGAPEGSSQPVGGRRGWLSIQGDTMILHFTDASAHGVVIQAPTSLGWDGARLARFAEGVTVLHNAAQGVG